MKETNYDEYDDDVYGEGLVTLVKFWAPWCQPCKKLSPILEELDQEDFVNIITVNADSEPDLLDLVAVRTLPTLVLYLEGIEVDRMIGVKSKQEIKRWIGDASVSDIWLDYPL